MFSWWQKHKALLAIDRQEAEIDKAARLLASIRRAQREYDRLIKDLASQGIQP